MADNETIINLLRTANDRLAAQGNEPGGDARLTPPMASTSALEPMIKSGVAGLGGIMNMPKEMLEASARDVSTLGDHNYEKESVDPATKMAMNLAGGGMPMAEKGAAGIFGGRLAQTADLKALQEAERMRMHGVHPSDVWHDTNWAKYPTDGKWRFEIPDDKTKMLQNGLDYTKDGTFVKGPTRAMFDFPELFKGYPDIRSSTTYNTVYRNPKNQTGRGSFNPETGTLEVEAPNLSKARSVGLHELQHAVQNIEGFTPGANPEHYAGLIEKGLRSKPDKFNAYDWDAIKKESHNLYHKTAGEVESRNVQKRMDYSPELRKIIPPWETMDVPFKDQMIYDPILDTVKALQRK